MRHSARTDEARAAALGSFMKANKGEVMMLSDAALDVEVIPTGTLSLDIALGVGGIPRGRIVELYGPEHSGKTSVCLDIAGAVIASGGYVAMIDAEHALDPEWAATFGVKKTHFAINQPMSGEEGLDQCIAMCESGAFDLVIVDSVAALTPKAEIEGNMDDMLVGAHARMMSKALRKITAIASSTGTTVLFINQLREKIGSYGNPETTTGGRALRFYSSVRLEVRSAVGDRKKKGTEIYGQTIRVEVKKNKVAVPFKKAEFDLIYGHGIDKDGAILDAAETCGVVTRPKGGTKYTRASTGEILPGTGKDAVKLALQGDAELRESLRAEITAALLRVGGSLVEDEADEAMAQLDAELAAAEAAAAVA